MIHEEVHRLAHQDDKLFIVCLIFRLLIPKQILACFVLQFVCLFVYFHFPRVFMCVPHEPGSKTSLHFSLLPPCGFLGGLTLRSSGLVVSSFSH